MRPVKFEAQLDSATVPVDVTGQDGRFQVTVEGRMLEVDARRAAEGIWSLLIGGESLVADVSEEDGVFVVQVDGETPSSSLTSAAPPSTAARCSRPRCPGGSRPSRSRSGRRSSPGMV
ncbi:MAG TPA: hypothetical protein VJA45_14625 [Methylomirabilota bacterium]|nr:hypothetical protein [Methylomirabilota bacterium]